MKNALRHRCMRLLVALALVLPAVNTRILGGLVSAGGQGERNVEEMTIPELLKERTGALMSIQGVVGTGQGLCEGKPCIKVYVVEKTPEVEKRIRRILEPYPYSIQESGSFRSR